MVLSRVEAAGKSLSPCFSVYEDRARDCYRLHQVLKDGVSTFFVYKTTHSFHQKNDNPAPFCYTRRVLSPYNVSKQRFRTDTRQVAEGIKYLSEMRRGVHIFPKAAL